MTLTELLSLRGESLAVSESLTGGLLADRVVAIPGASRVFRGGIVAYTDNAKIALLGVPADLLEREGAVSAAVAKRMAEGAARAFSSTVSLSTTGFAGPAATPDEPVGRVFVGLSLRGETRVYPLLLTGNREEIRRKTVDFAIKTLEEELTNF